MSPYEIRDIIHYVKGLMAKETWRLSRDQFSTGSQKYDHDIMYYDLSRHEFTVGDAHAYYLWVDGGIRQRIRVCWEGGQVLFEHHHREGQTHYSIRATNRALVEARLRGLI